MTQPSTLTYTICGLCGLKSQGRAQISTDIRQLFDFHKSKNNKTFTNSGFWNFSSGLELKWHGLKYFLAFSIFTRALLFSSLPSVLTSSLGQKPVLSHIFPASHGIKQHGACIRNRSKQESLAHLSKYYPPIRGAHLQDNLSAWHSCLTHKSMHARKNRSYWLHMHVQTHTHTHMELGENQPWTDSHV